MSYLKYVFLVCLYLAGIAEPSAAEFQLKLSQFDRLADEERYNVGNWQGIEASYGNNLFGFVSYEKAQIIPLWGIGDMQLLGAGFGYRYPITKKIRAFGKLGYYFISHEYEGRHAWRSSGDAGASEGMLYYMYSKYGFTYNGILYPDEYMIEYKNTIGGEIGLEFLQPVSKNTNLGFSLSYRSMKIHQLLRIMWDEKDFDHTGVCWEDGRNINYSSINYGVVLSYKF